MRIVDQKATIEDWTKMNLFERVERAGRICYNTMDKIALGTAEPFVLGLIERRHYSPLEFGRFMTANGKDLSIREALRFDMHDWKTAEPSNLWIPVHIVTSRAVSHELIRHRYQIAFMQESQRYVKFGRHIPFIRPSAFFKPSSPAEDNWVEAMLVAEEGYNESIREKQSPQAARLVLPNSTATNILVYAHPEEWAYIFRLRCSAAADPGMRELMIPLKEEMLARGLVTSTMIEQAESY